VAGLAAAFLVALPGSAVGADWRVAAALVPLLAVMGYIDDRHGLPVAPRLLGQFAAAVTVAWVAAGAGENLPFARALLVPLATLVLVWLVNAFNFMDGIDGLAASQAAFMAGAAAWLLATGDGAADSLLLCAGIAGAALGFLVLNWPPARIFMGDTGSQPLGFALGAATLLTTGRGELSPAVWSILWTAFLADATLTLGARAFAGKRVFAAHREHAYQRLALARGAHRPVTLGFVALNVLWLLPLAWLADAYPNVGWAIAAVAALPVAGAVAWIRCGPESPNVQ
jgi:Fuc2NAc and GlcNAc transferase